MSRASSSSQRSLTLTEELEKLEQSITLTLQEIDHNFSRAHRIVTSSILPIVEQYASHSKDVWEGSKVHLSHQPLPSSQLTPSKFWKQFFEASANVSLSGYEETPPDEETATEDTTTSATTPSSSSYASPSAVGDLSTATPTATYASHAASSPFPSPATHSTPRASHQPPTLASYDSPYETLRHKIISGHSPPPSSSDQPTTPRNHAPASTSPDASPFLPDSTARPAATDPLLHRVLDKTYRLQATPHAQARLPHRGAPTPGTARRARQAPPTELDSSPMAPPPEVRAEIFGTPAARAKRIPGVSVLTPARGKVDKGPSRDADRGVGWDSDSDDEDGMPLGMSPPKTMQFYIPQSRLLKTPAREASKRIVEGLLMTAGGDVTEEIGEEDSPSVVKRGGLLEEDTF
ncbi:DASH complex subunit ask1 [Xylographa parallela]|nr:DASH complex subunit ask1 [Xylographa parallela]